MKKIRFTIHGDPVAYLRMTQGQLKLMKIPDRWILSARAMEIKGRIRKYLAYKDAVYIMSLPFEIARSPKLKVYLNTTIYYSSGRHPDPENVRKGILDAIYGNDNKVAGSYDFFYDPEHPRVEVEIVQG